MILSTYSIYGITYDLSTLYRFLKQLNLYVTPNDFLIKKKHIPRCHVLTGGGGKKTHKHVSALPIITMHRLALVILYL